MSDQLSNKIIERIDADKITPLSRWHFVLWRGLFWLFAGLSVIIGGLAVGAMLFLLAEYYLRNILSIPHDVTEFLMMIPYLWLVVFLSFIIIARASIKHTKRGYQYRLRTIIAVSIVLSVILGSVFYLVGIGEITHKFFNGISLYNSVVQDAREAGELHKIRLLKNQ
ncbi:MAG: hypothetical protein V1896_00635 [Candidatus Zambryskibacteria bacterium]